MLFEYEKALNFNRYHFDARTLEKCSILGLKRQIHMLGQKCVFHDSASKKLGIHIWQVGVNILFYSYILYVFCVF